MNTGSRDLAFTIAVLAAFAYLARTLFFGGSSADLLAVWLSASQFAQGNLDQIYPPSTDLFTMQPPDGWLTLARGIGHDGPVYPYIYPPLWAALLAPLTAAVDLAAMKSAASTVNLALIIGTVVAAFRASRYRAPMWSYFAISLPLLSLTTPGLLAMHENQPQIMVSFLLVLTLERMRHNSFALAGLALALAASLKIFPAFFVILWIINGQWRAVGAFALFGGALAGASVWIAGWPLHALFLDQLVSISRTVLTTGYSYNLNSVIAYQFFDAQLLYVDAVGHPMASETVSVGWEYLPKNGLWRALNMVALLSAILWAAVRIRGNPGRECTVWVFAFGAMALLGPISWPYYYIPLLAFMPLVTERLGTATGLFILVVTLLPSTLTVPKYLYEISDQTFSPILLSTAGFTILTLVFAWLPGASRRDS